MSSTQISLTKNTWTQVTTTDKSGSIRHQKGNTTIVYTEAATIPTTLSAATPVMEATIKGEDFTYYKVPSTDFVWAHANSEDAVITVSPGGA
jgi:hypothetical protein